LQSSEEPTPAKAAPMLKAAPVAAATITCAVSVVVHSPS
jgi:hypothetical protein